MSIHFKQAIPNVIANSEFYFDAIVLIYFNHYIIITIKIINTIYFPVFAVIIFFFLHNSLNYNFIAVNLNNKLINIYYKKLQH